MKIELQIKDDAIKIFINSIIHVCVNQKELQGFQSWIGSDKYMIQFYLKGGKILCEYDSIDNWSKILTLLSKHNLFNRDF